MVAAVDRAATPAIVDACKLRCGSPARARPASRLLAGPQSAQCVPSGALLPLARATSVRTFLGALAAQRVFRTLISSL